MLNHTHFLDLLHGAQHALAEARRTSWDVISTDSGSPTPIEEDQLFWLIDVGLPKLERNWAPIVQKAGMKMRLSGVFCHKTPMALYDDSKNPTGPKIRRELGDLLLVHDHRGSNDRRQALLMQAKRMASGVLQADNPEQERLYSDWPDFELRGYGGDRKKFLPGDRDLRSSRDGVRYLLLDDDLHAVPTARFCHWCACFGCCDHGGWLISDPRGTVGIPGSEDLANTLVNMMYQVHPPRGQSVRRYAAGVQPSLGVGEDFDATVHEILTRTFTKDLSTTKRGRHKRKRGEETSFFGADTLGQVAGSPLAFMSADGGSDLIAPPPADPAEERGEAPGFAVILLETFGD